MGNSIIYGSNTLYKSFTPSLKINFNNINIKEQETVMKNGINGNKKVLESIEENNDSINNDIINNCKEIKDFYFVCSRCKCRNPCIENVKFDDKKMDFIVSYYCACFYNSNKLQEVYLNSLIDSQKPSNYCPIHSYNILKFYCKECQNSFCELCDKDSEEHKKVFINYNKIMSEDNKEIILKESSKAKYGNIYIKIINEHLNQFFQIDIPKYQLKKTFKRHSDKVTAIIQLHSGLIATGSYDTTIHIWDLEKSSPIKTIEAFGKVFALLEFEPNMLLSSSSDNKICLWDINSKKNNYIYKFTGHELWVNCLVKIDDKTFASASNDCNIIIWDYNQRKKINQFEAHDDCILALIKLKNGNLCSGSVDKLIKIWDSKDQRFIKDLKGHKKWIKCLCQMEDETILSGSDDTTIKVWKNYECIKTIIEGHSNSVRVLLKLNDNYFISGSFDKTIKIWDIKEFKCHQTLNKHSSNVFCILKLTNNNLISCSDNTIILWEKE